MTRIMRCDWANSHELFYDYHDKEWGIPEYNDQKLFEILTLESAQSGLSWLTILKKRSGYRKAFLDFDIQTVASFGQDKVEALLLNAEIVRHRQKIESTINNAKIILSMQSNGQSFSKLVWSYVNGTPMRDGTQPSKTALSDKMSKELKKLGFKFVGSTTCYSFLQAAGLVNDHQPHCFMCKDISE
ncbi:DNA-3-methyladenine glycosylase I [Temperatibacter marinus]|uniref:DNA-3-methyladenine glycosylase I n=1 Tax=Temperatibacter marinus TaxID=1456591 RepID=A0AA52HA14_9PROT|nr:DNA-3-methyladenine glycosylase I [Temperatibacter marinus]WND02153.1 DNA-3-methyladenine glycosylase I [Temperatibacter marinus]